jgi:hypothetical protein
MTIKLTVIKSVTGVLGNMICTAAGLHCTMTAPHLFKRTHLHWKLNIRRKHRTQLLRKLKRQLSSWCEFNMWWNEFLEQIKRQELSLSFCILPVLGYTKLSIQVIWDTPPGPVYFAPILKLQGAIRRLTQT